MALDFTDQELIQTATRDGILEAGSATTGPVDTETHVRVWPPSPATGVGGNTAGFLRYLTRNPASAIRVDVPLSYALTLDRAVTAPNAIIGVSFERQATSQAAYLYMTPGDTLAVPGGFQRFWIFNGDGINVLGDVPQSRPCGYCGFLITKRPGARPNQIRTEPLPAVRRIWQGAADPFAGCDFNRGACTRLGLRFSASNGVMNIARVLLAPKGLTIHTAAQLESETLDAPIFPTADGVQRFTLRTTNGGQPGELVTVPLDAPGVYTVLVPTVHRVDTGGTNAASAGSISLEVA